MLEKIWRSIDPEIFTVVEDLLEDTIQSVSPNIIVRLYDILFYLLVAHFSH